MKPNEVSAVKTGLQLGSPVPQNFQGELLTDIRDTGDDPADPSTRLYKTRAEQDFHTDGADVIGLLCLQRAKRGGESRLASAAPRRRSSWDGHRWPRTPSAPTTRRRHMATAVHRA